MANVENLPFHIQRYVNNLPNIPVGYTSILMEMTLCVIAPMESLGYTMPERLWPDISMGKMFPRYLAIELGVVDLDGLPRYWHRFDDGRPSVKAMAYPEDWIPWLRRYIREEWLPNRSISYFADRDPDAIFYLHALLIRYSAEQSPPKEHVSRAAVKLTNIDH